MGTLLKKPLCADSRVEVVEKDRAGIESRESSLYSELKSPNNGRLRLLIANPKLPANDVAFLDSVVPWGFRKMVGRSANGGSGCCTSITSGRVEHASWFYFLWQVWDGRFHSEKTDRIRIQWASVDVLVNWDSENNVTLVLFLGYINTRLRKALEGLVLQARDVRDPYTWHRVIINEVDEIYNDDVWKIYDSYRDLELSRTPDLFDFRLMHDVGGLLICACEIAEAAANTMSSIRRSHGLFAEELRMLSGYPGQTPQHPPGGNAQPPNDVNDRIIFSQTQQELTQLEDCLKSTFLFSKTKHDRLQNEISLAYNLVAQRDGELARVDNMTMKTIAAVTLAFLPGTFIATLFGMNFFNFSSEGLSVSRKLWVYWAIAIPLTTVIIGCWWAWDFSQKKWKVQRQLRGPLLKEGGRQGATMVGKPEWEYRV